MPSYPMTGLSDYYDYEDYFKRIDENIDINYWDVKNYGLIEEIVNLTGNTDLDYENMYTGITLKPMRNVMMNSLNFWHRLPLMM